MNRLANQVESLDSIQEARLQLAEIDRCRQMATIQIGTTAVTREIEKPSEEKLVAPVIVTTDDAIEYSEEEFESVSNIQQDASELEDVSDFEEFAEDISVVEEISELEELLRPSAAFPKSDDNMIRSMDRFISNVSLIFHYFRARIA
jgi:hypothetical protein